MKILITGSGGMLGTALCQELTDKYEVAGLDVRHSITHYRLPITQIDCDISDRAKTIKAIVDVHPEVVIHTAAYTDVDGCELDPDKAHRVNAEGTKNVALGAQKCGAILFYTSTDFVFDGMKKEPYRETDMPNPINVYGRSKLAGERDIRSNLDRFFIIRLSWLFGPGGNNFVDSIIEKANKETVLRIVTDLFSSPTYTYDLARAIKRLIFLVISSSSPVEYGIYHITNSGRCSRYEYTKAILKYAGIRDVNLVPIHYEDLNRVAKRPKLSKLDNSRYQKLTNHALQSWQEALKEYLQR